MFLRSGLSGDAPHRSVRARGADPSGPDPQPIHQLASGYLGAKAPLYNIDRPTPVGTASHSGRFRCKERLLFGFEAPFRACRGTRPFSRLSEDRSWIIVTSLWSSASRGLSSGRSGTTPH